jgi:hypothetical protein
LIDLLIDLMIGSYWLDREMHEQMQRCGIIKGVTAPYYSAHCSKNPFPPGCTPGSSGDCAAPLDTTLELIINTEAYAVGLLSLGCCD